MRTFNSGTFVFTVNVNDGVYLYVGGELIINKWGNFVSFSSFFFFFFSSLRWQPVFFNFRIFSVVERSIFVFAPLHGWRLVLFCARGIFPRHWSGSSGTQVMILSYFCFLLSLMKSSLISASSFFFSLCFPFFPPLKLEFV